MIQSLSALDLGTLLGVSERTLRRWEEEGSGPPRRIIDLEPRYPLESLIPWIRQHYPSVDLGKYAEMEVFDSKTRLRLLEAWESRLCERYRLISTEDLYAALRHADFHQRGHNGGPDKLESWHVASYAAFSGVLLMHDLSGEELKALLEDFESRADLGLAKKHNLSAHEFTEQIQGALDEAIAKEMLDGQVLRGTRDYVAIGHRYACQVTGKYSPPPGNPNIMEELEEHDHAQAR